MKNDTSKVKEPLVSYGLPSFRNPAAMIGFISGFNQVSPYLELLKENTKATDHTIAYWLNINVKTYRGYRKSETILKPDIKEHLIMLVALMKHGVQVFGSSAAFGKWLHSENFILGKKTPADLLNTNSGVRMVDDRLSGIEYGDNA